MRRIDPHSPVVLGVNLKMYFGYSETLRWCQEVAELVRGERAVRDGAIELFVLPSHPALVPAFEILSETGVAVGAQNMYWENSGPFTGEVSGPFLAELGCSIVEIGHAERRLLFNETDDDVARKVASALRSGLCPLICVGESVMGDPDAAAEQCTMQLRAALANVGDALANGWLMVAYEPYWAIGSSAAADPDHIGHVCRTLQHELDSMELDLPRRVIYGGSAGPGLLESLEGDLAGLFLGRRAHNVANLAAMLSEAVQVAKRRQLARDTQLPVVDMQDLSGQN